MKRQIAAAVTAALLLGGCVTVHESDLQSWSGRPVADLDKHPIFLTMPVVKTIAADGTEIRNYVNGRAGVACSANGTATGTISYAAYTAFSQCMAVHPACNNIFYIKNGIVERFAPIGTGGAHCFTDDRSRPDFAGAANL